MAPGPMGQTHAVPDDASLKELMASLSIQSVCKLYISSAMIKSRQWKQIEVFANGNVIQIPTFMHDAYVDGD
eukprot:scaffold233511_cov20-Prasinocladus_malaysianus.AAC.1